MPARNRYHDAAKLALERDGWTITHDPLRLEFGDTDLYVDLGAERAAFGAEKQGRKIAVEVQSFLGPSSVRDMQQALGQVMMYRTILDELDQDRILYLAVSREVDERLLKSRFGRVLIERNNLCVLVFDDQEARIVRWIESISTERS